MTIFRRLSSSGSRKASLAGLAIALLTLFGVALLTTHQAGAATCTSNDIIKCGFSSKSDFIKTVRANDNGVNSQADLQAIYAHYGLSAADYQDFLDHAVPGEARRNGDVIVNGQVVATGGMSVGRIKSFQGSNPFTVSIGGHDYFGNVNDQAFADGVSQLSVFVLFDSQGTMKFAVMPSCGNPEFAKPKKSNASCDMLNKTAVSGKADTYSFTSSASASGLAKITKYVYDFGDGSDVVQESSGSTPVTHTYTTPGTFTAKVTVFASVPGNSNVELPVVSECTKQVVVARPKPPTPPPPPVAVAVACKDLMAVMVDDNKMSFKFTATAQTSGPTFTSADFDFGDGNKQSGVSPDNGSLTATTTYTYPTAGTFTASAVLHFDNNGTPVTAETCTTTVTPAAPPVAPAAPTPPTQQVVVQTLPNTGAGNVIALFSVAVVGGFVGYRQLLFYRRRHADD